MEPLSGVTIILFVPLAIYALIVSAVAWYAARQLLYPPRRRPDKAMLGDRDGFEAVSFLTPDGLTLRGWFVPAPRAKGTASCLPRLCRRLHT